MNWTEGQKQAIEIKDKSILVSAAAGSGKTAVLVERIKQLITKEGLSLDELLIVTFTNAAASEMREKIVTAIPEQINQIHNAHISTFHSFALEVIRRYFHLTEIEPNFKICDEAQKILLQNEAMDRLFSVRFENRDKEFLNFIKLYGSSKNEDSVKSMISGVYNFLQSLPNPFEWLSEKTENLRLDEEGFRNSVLYEELMANINEEVEAAEVYFSKVCAIVEDHGIESLIPKATADLDTAKRVRAGFEKSFDQGRRVLNNAAFERFVAQKDDKADYEPVKEKIRLLRDNAKSALADIKIRYCNKTLGEYILEVNQTYDETVSLKNLVIDFDMFYRESKRKRNLLDFSDIEHLALNILSNEEASFEYRKKFSYIFIDEYQDSNLIQEAIINKIQRDNNVFMVGDVKQSIYKFRLAEPEIFIRKYEKFKNNEDPSAIKIDLNRNFRSKGPIINVVNRLFGKIMNRRSAGIEYNEDTALYKGIDYEGSLEHEVEFHLIDDKGRGESDDDEIKELKKVEIEAQMAAKLIKKYKGMPYYDVKKKEERYLKNKDMVILLRSAAGTAEVYHEIFEQEGIPVYMDTGDGYFDTYEISVFVNLLKVIDNRRQDVPLLSTLRSPIFNFSISDLAVIRSEFKTDSYFKAFFSYSEKGKDALLRQRCGNALDMIDKWKKLAGMYSLSDFIWKLILQTGYYNYIGALPGGAQRQANLRTLSDKALLYEGDSSKDLFGFINYIEAVKEKKIASAPTKLIGESDNVVRIMTVHKSKGLEYPFVLLGGTGKLFHKEGGKTVSVHKKLGLAVRHVNRELSFYRQTILQKLIDDRVSREAVAEEIRILYVALTRGMDKLIMLGIVTDVERLLEKAETQKTGVLNGRSYIDYLLPGLMDNIKLNIHDSETVCAFKQEQKEYRTKFNREMMEGFPELELVRKSVNKRLGWNYKHIDALNSKSKYSVSELSVGRTKPLHITGSSKNKSKGIIRGNAYHSIMERIPTDLKEYSKEAILRFALSLVEKEIITNEELSLVSIDKITKFFHSSLGQRMLKADTVNRETSFNLLSEKDGEDIIIQGIIDCYFIKGKECVLIDFKTDFVENDQKGIETLRERYENQLNLYKDALEQIRQVSVDEMYIYSFHLNREIKL